MLVTEVLLHQEHIILTWQPFLTTRLWRVASDVVVTEWDGKQGFGASQRIKFAS
jgi:hypothetical protein